MKVSSSSATNSGEGERKTINSELWHACAGPLVSLPPVGSLVVYFPQGHSEQVAASMQKDIDSIPNYTSLPSKMICMLHNADAETDEVYAQMTLQPVNNYDKEALLASDMGLKQNRQPTDFFCKTLTASDTSQPKRHLLTTGWSVFVSTKRLFAGDSVLFIRDERSQLLLGIRRANRQQPALSSSVLSSDSMHIGILAAAAHAAANNSPFTIFYNPRTSPSEFVIPLAKYTKAMYTQVSLGMRFRMMFETEESGVRRYMGTITGITDLDPIRWKKSQWRNLQVGWDESTTDEDSEIESAFKRAMPWLNDEIGTKDGQNPFFSGLNLVQWMSMQQNPQLITSASQAGHFPSMIASALQNSLNTEDSSKLLSFQTQPLSLPNFIPKANQHTPQGNQFQQSPLTWPQQQQQQSHQQPPQQPMIQQPTPQQQHAPIHPQQQMHQESQQRTQQKQVHQAHQPQQQLQHVNINPGNFEQQQTKPHQSLQPPLNHVVGQLKSKAPVRDHSALIDGDTPSCSTSPSTNNFHVTSVGLLDISQQVPATAIQETLVQPSNGFAQEHWSKASQVHVKNESLCTKESDQPAFRSAVIEHMDASSSATSLCMDGSGHENFSLPNFCLDGGVPADPRNNGLFGDNVDGLTPDTFLSRGFGSGKDLQNLISGYGSQKDIETEISTAAISSQSFGVPNMSFKPGCSSDTAVNETGMLNRGVWSNQPQRMRTFTKVQKRGSVGRSIDVTRYRGYDDLRHDLARMFGIEGQLENPHRTDWKLVYVDHENDILLVGDDPWEEFVSCVQSIKILSASEVQQMSLDGDLASVPIPQNQACSASDNGNLWSRQYDDN
ncbi:Auxin response factor 16 [Acorus calamus]|uniref:Auxin-responsive protein n=1 Tax=Acorus calamus TaxID=4465 RepID=A0AAV9EIZ4_ACOCL|nr:Auxin response factor 16 [Acorus calamus]